MGAIRRIKTKRRARWVAEDVLRLPLPHVLTPRTRDLDQIHADLRSPKHLAQHKSTKAVEDLPGLGQWYCIECAKWFEGENSLLQHRKGKNHKRR